MKICKVKMPYIGKALSVNHYKYKGQYYTRKETQAWMDELGWLIKAEHIEDWKLPLTVKCDGIFRNQRSQPDLSNLSKVILDAIQETTGVNDKNMRWVDGNVTYDKDPYLMITITEAK